MNRKNRIHDWRKLKWPFIVTFVYYALISLFTGVSEAGEAGFFAVLLIALVVDAAAYLCYCLFLSRDAEDIQKLWFVFILIYVLLTSEQLGIIWQRMQERAGTL